MMSRVPTSSLAILDPSCYKPLDEWPGFIARGNLNFYAMITNMYPIHLSENGGSRLHCEIRMLHISPRYLHIKYLI